MAASRRRPFLVPWLLTCVFFAVLASQWLVTPVGEGMDVYGHLAYARFMAREGRWPLPGEPSVAADVARLRDACVGPDYLCPGIYRRWRALDAGQRRAWILEATRSDPSAPYVDANYQAQHPPLYYALLAPLVSATPTAPLDAQIFILGLVSIAMASLAMPSTYALLRHCAPEPLARTGCLALAWFPNLLPFLGRVTNDSLAFALAAALFLGLVTGPAGRRRVIVVAALLGAGLWTKYYFVTFVPVVLAWSAWRPEASTMLGAPLRGGSTWRARVDLAQAGLGLLVLGTVTSPLLWMNLTATGHVLPLAETQLTTAAPLAARLAGLFAVDPIWFVTGMARNFVWVGYWSFVSPAYSFYVLFAGTLLLVLLSQPARAWRWGQHSDVAAPASSGGSAVGAWIVGGVTLMFLLGMWWHAGLFRLDASLRGLARYSGNEGYYLNVLLPGLLAVLVPLLARRGFARARRALAVVLTAMIGFNLVARVSMLLFWGGSVVLVGRERLMLAGDIMPALRSQETWTAAFSLPGMVSPTGSATVLGLALGLTWWVMWQKGDPPQEPGSC